MERWETQLIRGGQFEIVDKVNRQCERGWEPFSHSVAVDAAYCEHFVMLRCKVPVK